MCSDMQQTSAVDEKPSALAGDEQQSDVGDDATADIVGARIDVQTATKSDEMRTV
jgi:hypothetical protein